MLDYNVPGGKLNRGMAVYDVLASIKGAEVRARKGGKLHRGGGV
jgi:ATP-dependent protease ClpP protease subunit